MNNDILNFNNYFKYVRIMYEYGHRLSQTSSEIRYEVNIIIMDLPENRIHLMRWMISSPLHCVDVLTTCTVSTMCVTLIHTHTIVCVWLKNNDLIIRITLIIISYPDGCNVIRDCEYYDYVSPRKNGVTWSDNIDKYVLPHHWLYWFID